MGGEGWAGTQAYDDGVHRETPKLIATIYAPSPQHRDFLHVIKYPDEGAFDSGVGWGLLQAALTLLQHSSIHFQVPAR